MKDESLYLREKLQPFVPPHGGHVMCTLCNEKNLHPKTQKQKIIKTVLFKIDLF